MDGENEDIKGSNYNYGHLPDPAIVNILYQLPCLRDRFRASLACKAWKEGFDNPQLWKSFNFVFYTANHIVHPACLQKYGKFFEQVHIEVDQSLAGNRENACQVIRQLASLNERRVTHLTIHFVGQNPLFYAGVEFIEALKELFGPVKDETVLVKPLKSIDLSKVPITFDSELFNHLAENHIHLEHLNIQNQVAICKVHPNCLLKLVQRCRHFESLHCLMCSVSEEVLMAFTEDGREPLKHLSLRCSKEEKFAKNINSEIWSALVSKFLQLRVTLIFDHMCPFLRIAEIMQPEIPVCELRLETFTYVHNEVKTAAVFYKDTLEKVVVNTPHSRDYAELNDAVLELATKCTRLKELHVYCLLKEVTVHKILALHPKMKEREAYTLKWYLAPAPWLPGPDVFPIDVKSISMS